MDMPLRYRIVAFSLLGIGLAVIWTAVAHAQGVPPSVNADTAYKGIINAFANAAHTWEAPLKALATRLFWSLFLIELIWTGARLALKGADFAEFITDFVKLILFFGFFFALLLYGSAWAHDIVLSFQAAAGKAGGQETMSPGGVLLTGLEAVRKLGEQNSVWHPISNAGRSISAIVLLACFAFIAAFMAITIIESYIVIGAAVFFFGFGGSRWTAEFAKKVLFYVVSVGAKLFLMQLIVAAGMSVVKQWVTAYTGGDASTFALIGMAIMIGILTWQLPNLVQSLIAGVGGHGSGIGAFSAMAMGAAAAATGGIAAVGSAAKLAAGQVGAKLGGSAASSLAGAATKAPGGLPTAVSAMPGAPGGTTGGRGAAAATTNRGPMSGRSVAQATPASGGGTISGAGSSAANDPAAGAASSPSTAGDASSGGGDASGAVPDSPADASSPATEPAAAEAQAAGGEAGAAAAGGKPMTRGQKAAAYAVGVPVMTMANLAFHMAKHTPSLGKGMGSMMSQDMQAKHAALKRPRPPGGASGLAPNTPGGAPPPPPPENLFERGDD